MNARESQQRTMSPFGIEIDLNDSPLLDLNEARLQALLDGNALLVLRNVAAPTDEQLLEFSRRRGTILEWEFGPINELRIDPQAKNYLYTQREVPFHWDGAFIGTIPWWIVFHCAAAEEGQGGETLFCDTRELLKSVPATTLETWQKIEVTYSTEKIVHYGGEFTSPLVASHPIHGTRTLRFAQPVNDLNPVCLEISGLTEDAHDEFLSTMDALLKDPKHCVTHAWRTGDVVLADNHALLHGRLALAENARRHLRRVNVLHSDEAN